MPGDGPIGEGSSGEERDVIQGGVAAEDLDEEPVEDGDKCEQAGPPGVAGLAAGVVDGPLVEVSGEVLPESSEGDINSVMHPGASRCWCHQATPGCREALVWFECSSTAARI
jgi:hypothetical protein